MGPKSFEQSAGFLKIPESSEALDNTWVHPENYAVARDIQKELSKGGTVTVTGNLSAEILSKIKEEYKVGDTTINDIIEELKKPNRDPREGYPQPVMQKGVITFEDLSEGMTVTGKIKNVVDFGAFVDLGIKETALVHISEMSDSFVKDPMSVVKVGDVLEFRIIGLDKERRRISLTRKSGQSTVASQSGVASQSNAASQGAGKAPHAQKHAGQGKTPAPIRQGEKRPVVSEERGRPPQAQRGRAADDDGTMYNPFADAFRKMKK
jgi:uncharacterized protein